MKIAIITALSVPTNISLKEYISPDDPICNKIFHPHPWVTNLAQGLSRIKGNEVHVLTMMGDVNQDRVFVYKNVHYHLVKSTPVAIKAATLFKSNKWKMHAALNTINPDVVHGQGRAREGYFAVTSKYPCVITNHGRIDEHFMALYNGKRTIDYYIRKYKGNRVNKRVKYFISVSPNCEENSLRYVEPEHSFLIDNAIDYCFFEKYENRFSDTLLFVGSITNLKQVVELIKAVENVEVAYVEIVSGTYEGEYYEKVKRYVKENNLCDRVRFAGFMKSEDVAKKISDSLAVCLPSKYESFGMVLAEAMAVGKPVIASNVGGIPHVVKDGINGLLSEPGNIGQLSEKIRFLINNRDVAIEMGEKGREEAVKRWHPDIIAEKTMKVYEKVIEDQRGNLRDQRKKLQRIMRTL